MGSSSSIVTESHVAHQRRLSLNNIFNFLKTKLGASNKISNEEYTSSYEETKDCIEDSPSTSSRKYMKKTSDGKVKILLLGAGECGKSTVLKQIKYLSKIEVTKNELLIYRQAIRCNAIESIQTLLLVAGELGEELRNIELMNDVEEILTVNLKHADENLTPELAKKISMMWKDEGIQSVYNKREYFHMMDSAPYYLDEVERLAEKDFEPTEDDIIMARIRTDGFTKVDVVDGSTTYMVVDVGGQRVERRKWTAEFDEVKSIIFLEGLSGYNQCVFEGPSSNRMKESMSLFAEIVQMEVFKNTPISVFLNKKDLFETMITKYPLQNTFPDYDGPNEAIKALAFIEKKYRDIYELYRGVDKKGNKTKGGGLSVQIVSARVRMDIKQAFGDVKDKLKKFYKLKG